MVNSTKPAADVSRNAKPGLSPETVKEFNQICSQLSREDLEEALQVIQASMKARAEVHQLIDLLSESEVSALAPVLRFRVGRDPLTPNPHPRKAGEAAANKAITDAAAKIVKHMPAKVLAAFIPSLLEYCTLSPVFRAQVFRLLGLPTRMAHV